MLAAVLAVASGCTTVGMHTTERGKVDYGPAQEMRLCLLKSPDVPENRADELVAAVSKEFATYGIHVTVPWVHEWERPAFTATGILEDIMRRDLEPPCDRLMGLVDRHAGDFVWGLLLPEVLGAVDGVSRTRGYVVATFGSINQVTAEPQVAIVHEFYHLVGCGHGVSKTKCYHKIAEMKASRPPESDFFPGMEMKGKFILTREEANQAVRTFLAEREAKKKR
ncbi:MAG: hypothetical protein ACT4UQ_05770 [Gammaproteobacteria bacterium]